MSRVRVRGSQRILPALEEKHRCKARSGSVLRRWPLSPASPAAHSPAATAATVVAMAAAMARLRRRPPATGPAARQYLPAPAGSVFYGRVESIEPLTNTRESSGIVGTLLGSAAGGGRPPDRRRFRTTIATIGGAVLSAVAGNVSKRVGSSTSTAYRVNVRTDDGRLATVTQSDVSALRVGARAQSPTTGPRLTDAARRPALQQGKRRLRAPFSFRAKAAHAFRNISCRSLRKRRPSSVGRICVRSASSSPWPRPRPAGG